MNVLMAHNYYRAINPSGENESFEVEKALLQQFGHHVIPYIRNSDEVYDYPFTKRVALIKRMIWADDTYRDVKALIAKTRPVLAHFQNTFPLISPSAYEACRQMGIPVVQTLRNYRLLCPNSLFFRDGHICEDCLQKFIPWPSVYHGCYRESRLMSSMVALMLVLHRIRRTWINQVNIYIALTEFARQKFIGGGLPPEKIIVKPNFVYPDPGMGNGLGKYGLFVGRLSNEKGLDILLSSWSKLNEKIGLKIVGDGPLYDKIAQAASRLKGVELLGKLSGQVVISLMKEAKVLLFPSLVYEGFPRVIAEAYAVGLPVISSNIGSMSTIIDHGRTGLHFFPGDSEDLTEQLEWILSHPKRLSEMRWEARGEYEEKYTAERNYSKLIQIYDMTLTSYKSYGSRSVGKNDDPS